MLLIAGRSAGQSLVPATTSANISVSVTVPVTISKLDDFHVNLDGIDLSDFHESNYTIDPGPDGDPHAGAGKKTGLQGAGFLISGERGYMYAVNLPATPVRVNSGKASVTLSEFTSSRGNTACLGNNIQLLHIGARLRLEERQARTTAAAPLMVMVSYY